MKLPITSWKNTFTRTGFRVVRKKRKSLENALDFQTLEPRQMLASGFEGNPLLVNAVLTDSSGNGSGYEVIVDPGGGQPSFPIDDFSISNSGGTSTITARNIALV